MESTPPSERTESHIFYQEKDSSASIVVAKVAAVAGPILLIIASLALASYLLPHSAIGMFMLSYIPSKGILALTISTGLTGLGAVAAAILIIYLKNRNESRTKKSLQGQVNELDKGELVKKEHTICILNHGLAEEKGPLKSQMQDTSIAFSFKYKNSMVSVLGVYDGHGDAKTSQFIKENFEEVFKKQFNKGPEDEEAALKNTYLELDEMTKGIDKSGSCALTAVFIGNKLFVANAGDSRAVISKNGAATRLTRDHNAKYEEAAKEVVGRGGCVTNNRVNGQLQVTRAIGDHDLKPVITAEPEIIMVDLEQFSDSDNYLILACDGLWDVVSDKEAIDTIFKNEGKSLTQISQTLINNARNLNSYDDTTVIIVNLNQK